MHRLFLFTALMSVPIVHLDAQWYAALTGGRAGTVGHARSTDDAPDSRAELLPWRPATLALRIGRDLSDWRVGIEARRTTSDLAARGEGTVLVTTNVADAWGAGVEVTRRLAGGAGRPALRAGVGVLAERWSFDLDGGDARWRLAAQGVLDAGVPLWRRWSGVIRAEAALGRSLFDEAELPVGYELRPAVRHGVAIGVALRL